MSGATCHVMTPEQRLLLTSRLHRSQLDVARATDDVSRDDRLAAHASEAERKPRTRNSLCDPLQPDAVMERRGLEPLTSSLQSCEDANANGCRKATYDTRIATTSTNASTAGALPYDSSRFDAWLDACPLALCDRQRWAIRALARTTR